MIRDFFFPHTLRRLGYFWRLVLFQVFCYWSILSIEEISGDAESGAHYWTLLGIFIVGLAYFLIWVVIPRIRDAGLPKWTLVLLLIPYVEVIAGLGLMFVGTRFPRPVVDTAKRDGEIRPEGAA